MCQYKSGMMKSQLIMAKFGMFYIMNLKESMSSILRIQVFVLGKLYLASP
jgi:hypothetical protein